jgi:hypothetical protein
MQKTSASLTTKATLPQSGKVKKHTIEIGTTRAGLLQDSLMASQMAG